MKYTIAKGSSTEELEQEVEERLEFGWKLSGGVSSVFAVDEVWFFQAMIKD